MSGICVPWRHLWSPSVRKKADDTKNDNDISLSLNYRYFVYFDINIDHDELCILILWGKQKTKKKIAVWIVVYQKERIDPRNSLKQKWLFYRWNNLYKTWRKKKTEFNTVKNTQLKVGWLLGHMANVSPNHCAFIIILVLLVLFHTNCDLYIFNIRNLNVYPRIKNPK